MAKTTRTAPPPGIIRRGAFIRQGFKPLPNEMPNKNLPPLPQDWRWVKLGEVCTVIRGASPRPMGDPKYFSGTIPFLKIADITSVAGKFVYNSKTKVNALGAEKSRLLKRGALVLTNSASVCIPKFLGADACIHDGFVSFLDFQQETELTYLYHFFDYLRPYVIQKHRQGITQVNLNTEIVNDFDIPLPPLATQQAIVAKIEQLFSELDKGIEPLKLAQQQLKTYRQSVLKAAFEGRLVGAQDFVPQQAEQSPQRRPDGESPALTPSPSLGERGEQELPAGWKWVKLGEVAETILGKMLDKAKNKGQLQPYLRNINVRWGNFDTDDLLEMRFEADEAERYGVKKGDLIVCEGGEPGRCAVWTEENSTMKIQKALHRVRLNNGNSPYYLYYYFVFAARAHLLEKFFTGTTIKHFTGQSLRAFEFPLPPLAEQHAIVAAIESRLSVADQLEATLAQSLTQAESLRQAVLKQAFEGRLV